MAVTSTMLPLGTEAPAFELVDSRTGTWVSIDDFKSAKGLLVMFICNHCPYVRHIRHGLADLGRDYEDSDIAIVAISSNDADRYPTDTPAAMKSEADALDYRFPYLFDETQAVAQSYTAMCTPDFFLFDADRRLVYRGRFDDARPNTASPVTGAELRAAMDALLAHQPISDAQHPSMGCSIKWKPGNVPAYFES